MVHRLAQPLGVAQRDAKHDVRARPVGAELEHLAVRALGRAEVAVVAPQLAQLEVRVASGEWRVVSGGAWYVVMSWWVVRGGEWYVVISWCLVRGAWNVVRGECCLVRGAWSVVRGEW